MGEEGVEDQEDIAPEAGPPGDPSISSDPQENAPSKVARDPGDPTTQIVSILRQSERKGRGAQKWMRKRQEV